MAGSDYRQIPASQTSSPVCADGLFVRARRRHDRLLRRTGNPYLLGYAAPFSASYPLGSSNDHGVVAGGGSELGLGRIHVAPEVRYIRSKDPLYAEYGSRGYYVAVPQNEVQMLLGLSWR